MIQRAGNSGRSDEWAVILAGGDGTRLKSLTRRISGDERPKQFCHLMGAGTLLDQTRRRVALEVAAKRTLYVVNRAHEPYYAPLLAGETASNLVVQPRNCGTAPAILYSLLRIAAVDPTALVVFCPSDHYISDDEKFMAHIRSALDAARHRRGLVVLLGIQPESPEVEYGWIEPSQPILIPGGSRLLGVRRFWEKPNSTVARLLQVRGCLWNSFVMVSSVAGLLELIENAMPGLCREFARLQRALGTLKEAERANSLYQSLTESNFSHQVLAACPERLAALRVSGVKWNDLGEPKRVIASLSLAGLQPQWAANLMAQPA
ncbi:MAG: sugar phosphate nucleotidyltransferase [Candidatus Binatia bacterium]